MFHTPLTSYDVGGNEGLILDSRKEKNMSNLKELWITLKMWEKLQKEFPTWDGSVAILKAKKAIRQYYHDEETKKDPYIVSVFHEDYDGYIEKIVASVEPDETLEDVKGWFNDNYYIHYYNRGYDCTGQLFTAWYRIFKTSGNWIIYHRICADV